MTDFPNPFAPTPADYNRAFGREFKMPETGVSDATKSYTRRDGTPVTDKIFTWGEVGMVTKIDYLEPGHDDNDPNLEQLWINVQLASDPIYDNTNPGQFLDRAFLKFHFPLVATERQGDLKSEMESFVSQKTSNGTTEEEARSLWKQTERGIIRAKFWSTKFNSDLVAELLIALGHETRLHNRKILLGLSSILDLVTGAELLNTPVRVIIDYGKINQKTGEMMKEIKGFRPYVP